MNTIDREQLLQQLHWRYATKQFDSKKKVSAEDWAALEEALILSPSSYGLQPWKFIVITDHAVREKLVEASWKQRQVADCSHLVVLAIKKDLNEKDVNEYIKRIKEIRGTSDWLKDYEKMMLNSVNGPLKNHINEWATNQVYIALGNLMTSAALMGIDTCPMEGFERAKYDEILGLTKQGLGAVVLCPVGYRSEEDKYAQMPKVRFKKEDVIIPI